jgi:hypothetical protein
MGFAVALADCVLDLFPTSHSHWPLFYGFVKQMSHQYKKSNFPSLSDIVAQPPS